MTIFAEIEKEYSEELERITANLKKQVRFQKRTEAEVEQYASWLMAKKAIRSCR